MRSKNSVIIAAAGSGKTTELVEKAYAESDARILITTFTVDNSEEIKNKFFELFGFIPKNVHIQTWFSFLLGECVRPYQNHMYDCKRIENIEFVNGQSTKWIPKSSVDRYYLRSGKYIYTDKICDFVCGINQISNGAVINRLEKMYDIIMIDEVQDMAGPDLDFLYLLLLSNLKTIMVGDNRQAIYFTNNASKNKKFKGEHIFELFRNMEANDICTIEYKRECRRSNQLICDLADALYSEMPTTISTNTKITGHDGIFYIESKDVMSYVHQFSPRVLRYSKATRVPDSINALNFGKSKGQTFNRVLIYSNGPISKFLKTGNVNEVSKSRAGLYVAITRARYSVTFVYDELRMDNKHVSKYSVNNDNKEC